MATNLNNKKDKCKKGFWFFRTFLFKGIVAYAILIALLLLALGCSDGSTSPKVNNPTVDFDPKLRGPTDNTVQPGTPLDPLNLRSTPGEGTITLTWEFPKTYKYPSSTIGYVVLKDENQSKLNQKWDLESDFATDWTYRVATLKVTDAACTSTGVCTYTSKASATGVTSFAVLAFWDVAVSSSPRSQIVTVTGTSNPVSNPVAYDDSITRNPPSMTYGAVVPEILRTPQVGVMKLKPDITPWYYMDGTGPLGTRIAPRLRARAPILAGMSPDGRDIIVPEQGFYRAARLTKGDDTQCDPLPVSVRGVCKAFVDTKPFTFLAFLGQKTTTYATLPASNNLLDNKRKFVPQAVSIQRGSSGKQYVFVSDLRRVLVREWPIKGCDFDEPGTASIGDCGFSHSIGTISPEVTCSHKAFPTRLLTDATETCFSHDEAASDEDVLAPEAFTLRRPGKVAVSRGTDLVIPDAGNARIVRLKDFENALKTCGKGDAFCQFDMVIGQTGTDASDAGRFTNRNCVVGGEQGGMLGGTTLDPLAGFQSPIPGKSGYAGIACGVETYFAAGDATRSPIRKARVALDFDNYSGSEIGAETGLLKDSVRRMFRAPLQVEFDKDGWMYVLDAGDTIAVNRPANRAATLPTRVMMWRVNPFALKSCTPVDPNATPKSCTLRSPTVCEGIGCSDKQCFGPECNASMVAGQQNDLYGWTHGANEILGETVNPPGFFPIGAFAVSDGASSGGLWAVTGRDARILFWPKADLEKGDLLNPIVLNTLSGNASDDAAYRSGVFSGVIMDPFGGRVIGIDSLRDTILGWSARPK